MYTHPFARRGTFAAVVVSLTALAAASSAEASSITWGAATNISGDADVSTTGVLLGAFGVQIAPVVSPTVNGVTFTGVTLAGVNVTSGIFDFSSATAMSSQSSGVGAAPFNTLSASYQALLGEVGGGVTGATMTLTISGLVIGQSYEFQWFRNNSVGPTFGSVATAGNSVLLDGNVTDATGGLGQFAIGSFIADGATQQIVFQGATSLSAAFLNGGQLRQTAAAPVPEPATLSLVALGLAGAAVRRYRRRR